MNSEDSGQRWVFGLCAQWCGVCRDWRAAFDAAAARHPRDRFIWVDVEDEDELVGDLDIETFPTLLVGTSRQVLFFGTILPSPELLTRLLASLDGSGNATPTAEAQALLQRLVTAQL
ncbi:MAG: protein-disulfide reductase (thioredoxin)-like protein [Ramlibacter sp.]|nr:protein-disulfide reductase (thioredoxin)-like protein [Ramlibacter sp.]